MWEAYGLENEDFLWAGIPFLGGIGGYQKAPCGALSGAALAVGLRHRCPLDDEEKAKQARHAIRTQSWQLAAEFEQQFGATTCLDLIGMDFAQPGEYKKFLDSGIWKDKCQRYAGFMIEKLYALEKDRGLFVQAP